MTTLLIGPPPLPPNKKSLLTRHNSYNNNYPPPTYKPRNHITNNNRHPPLLSSTYRSFKDPADDPIILSYMLANAGPTNDSMKRSRKQHCQSTDRCYNQQRLPRRRTLSNHLLTQWNSTQGDSSPFEWTQSSVNVQCVAEVGGNGKGANGITMTRSQSEGNLRRRDEGAGVAPMTINKYMKVLSSSWKNLLNLGGMSRPPKPAATAKKVAPPAVPHEFRHSGSSFGSSAGYASSSEDGGFLAPPGTTVVVVAGVTGGGGGGSGGGGSDSSSGGSSGGGSGGGLRDDHSDYGSSVSGSTGKSPGPIIPAPTFSFPGAPALGTVLTHKAAVYYHHQLSLQEDQGIDMTQSPGRDSPGSSSGSAGSGSRHSTASLDSGRASYHPLGGGSTGSSGGGITGGGRSTIGSANSPRCSLSSCSIGSVPEQGRIERMINQGLPDQEIIHAWLVDLQFDEYFPLFLTAGYDLPTIGRMTPEDLTAIGIKKPNHRKRLKAEIAQLNLPDNLPDYIPGSLEEWLSLLRLDEYHAAFLEQGYHTVDAVAQQLTWEDLEEFGVVKLGHQKKIMLAIKRIKDIRLGKRFCVSAAPGGVSDGIGMSTYTHQTQDVVVHAPPSSPSATPSTVGGVGILPPPAVHSTFRSFHQPWELDQTRQLAAAAASVYGYQVQQPQSQSMYCTDIVPIKIRTIRGKSLESLEDPSEHPALSTHHTFTHAHLDPQQQQQQQQQQFYYSNPPNHTQQQLIHHQQHMLQHQQQQQQQQQLGGWRPRSYDDGDITPTNETGLIVYEGGGGTLPRPRCVIKPRPVAKIQAKSRDGQGGVATVTGPVSFPDYEKPHFPTTTTATSSTYKPLMDPILYHHHLQHQLQLNQQQLHQQLQQQYHHHHQQQQQQHLIYSGSASVGASPVMGKKVGPNPPKRMDSVGETGGPEMGITTVEVHQVQSCSPSPLTISTVTPSSTPLPLPAYPSSDSLSISLDAATLPPPPAPGTPPGMGGCCAANGVVKMNASRSWGADSESAELMMMREMTLLGRNGSDASFKSSSSTESDSLPFANENAGTIRTRPSASAHLRSSLDYNSSSAQQQQQHQSPQSSKPPRPSSAAAGVICTQQSRQQTSEDVLSDIGNMLTNLTNELDAMLEEEKRMEQEHQQ